MRGTFSDLLPDLDAGIADNILFLALKDAKVLQVLVLQDLQLMDLLGRACKIGSMMGCGCVQERTGPHPWGCTFHSERPTPN